MAGRRGLLGEVSWFQVVASALAAVTAAWLASRLGVTGTLVGAALGSFVVTITTAVYGRTLDRGRTLIVETASGTLVQRRVEDGEVAEALEEVADVTESPVRRAEVVEDAPEPGRLHWRTIAVTTVVVLALALAAISAYELATGRTLDGDRGTTIGDTFGGSRGDDAPATPRDDVDPSDTPTTSLTTPTDPASSSTATPTSPVTSTPTTSAPTPTSTPE